jgi:histone H1/5
MVLKAISNLEEGDGLSMQAIKLYVAANYKIDSHKMTLDINMFLKAAVASGDLLKTKGKGSSCFFKFPGAQARHRRDASSRARELKQRAAKTKAKLALTTALNLTREKKTRTSPNKENAHLRRRTTHQLK